MTKSIFLSKTFWANAIAATSAIVGLVDPTLLGLDPRWMLLISGIVNIALRLITTGGVSLTGGSSGNA